MKICFYNGKEKVDNAEYPVGNMLMTFVNEFEYNEKTVEQKDGNLMRYTCKVCSEIIGEDLKEIFDKTHSSEIKKETVILKVNFDESHSKEFVLSNAEFRELLKIVECIKTFIRLKGNDLDYFMYYFNTYWGYIIPQYKVKNNEAEYKSNKELLEKQKDATNEEAFWNATQETMEESLKELKYLGKNRPSSFITEYECNNIVEILLASLHYISSKKIKIQTCGICDRVFIPKSNCQRYCNNIRPRLEHESNEDYNNVTETCSQYNRNHPNINKLGEVNRAKRRVRQRIQKRIREGKESAIYLKKWEQKVEKTKDYYPDQTKYTAWILNDSDENQKRKRNGK